jgi:hypothetical protein
MPSLKNKYRKNKAKEASEFEQKENLEINPQVGE